MKKSIAYDDTYLAGHIALIKILGNEGQEQEVLKLIEAVRKLTPGTPAGDLLTGELYLGLGQLDRALKFYRAALSLGDSRQGVLGVSLVLQRQGATEEALGVLRDWLRRYPGDPQVELALAGQLLHANTSSIRPWCCLSR